MTLEQFDLIIAAILDGKYSWACVLMLRFYGYDPVDYVPCGTYNRLLKENRQLEQRKASLEKQFSLSENPATDLKRDTLVETDGETGCRGVGERV